MSGTNTLVMDLPQPTSLLDTGAQGLIGRDLARTDGPLKVAGRATYAAEYDRPNLAYGVLVRAAIGKGKIVSIDAQAAMAIPGVVEVVSDFASFAAAPGQGGDTKAPPMGVEQVQYLGEFIAVVVADSFEAARDAAQRLKVDYAPVEGAYDFERAKTGKLDKPEDNQIPSHYDQGDLDQAMADAPVTLDVTYTTPSQNSAAMEPHASIAEWDGDQLTIWGSYQMPATDRTQLAKALRISEAKVRIVSRYVGGGFGSKLGIAPEAVAAALAAKRVARPVKIAMARQQVFDGTVRRSNTEQRVRLAARSDGTLTGIGHDTICSNLPGQDFFEPAGISTHFLYPGEHRRIHHDIARVDWLLAASMRAPGEAVGMLATECALDELADRLGIDPVELRRRNEPERDPEHDVPFSSRQLLHCMDEGAERFGWSARAAKPCQRREGDQWIGMGMASAARGNMLQKSSASITLSPHGRATVKTDMTDIGTGTYTILGQIAGEILGLPLSHIDVQLGDTDNPPAAGSGGSFGAGSSGTSVYLAAEQLRGELAKAMGVDEQALVLKDGQATAEGRTVSIASLVGEKGMEATGQVTPGKQEKETKQASYGAHFAEVSVDAWTGEVRVRRFLGVFAAGRILNAQTARAQLLGGITFGIGAALSEELIHDTRNGKLVNRDLGEYHVPVNADVPQIEAYFLTERDIHANPMHAKGIGELGISGAGAAIANAVYNACGVRVRDYPLTLDKLLPHLPPA